MGEKGITDESYIRYQKAELTDAVFLQQNSFHDVDGVTDPARLKEMYAAIRQIIDAPVHLEGKESIRSHFNFIRQAFIDWNTIMPDDDAYHKQRSKIMNLVKQGIHATENV